MTACLNKHIIDNHVASRLQLSQTTNYQQSQIIFQIIKPSYLCTYLAVLSLTLLAHIWSGDAAGLNSRNRDVHIDYPVYDSDNIVEESTIVEPRSSLDVITDQHHYKSSSPVISTKKKIVGDQYECGRSIPIKNASEWINSIEYNSKNNKYKPMEINPFRQPRIVGGDITRPGEFPWIASIKLGEQPICGGSLINREWVLTAAHCVVGYSPKSLTIRLGAFRIKDTEEKHSVERNISIFVIHRDYSMPRPFSNDIALIKLAKSIDYSDYIIPICMPEQDQTKQINNNDGSPSTDIESNEIVPPSSSKPTKLTADGIVITDKMSDLDIVKSLYHLEQNYLAAMGLTAENIGIGAQTSSSIIKSLSQDNDDDNDDNVDDNSNNNNSDNNPVDNKQKDEDTTSTIESYYGINGTVVGWGWIKDLELTELVNKGYPSSVLQKVQLPILRNDDCELWFQSQGKKITLLTSQFCAGYKIGGKDACRGDSGGPMVNKMPDQRHLLIGIVSAGIGCARPGLPGLYTRVASYIDWINVHVDRYQEKPEQQQ